MIVKVRIESRQSTK